jgi:hypothetical protein
MPIAPDALPSEQDLQAVATLDVVNETGSKVPFGSLYEAQRTIVIFIRRESALPCSSASLQKELESQGS